MAFFFQHLENEEKHLQSDFEKTQIQKPVL